MVNDALKVKLMPCRLACFSHITGEMEPFLTSFQMDALMAPFLYTELQSVLVSLLSMIVKKDVMSTTYLWKIDLNDKSADVILP